MWRKIFSPEFLFFTGTVQAISPYLMWSFYGSNPYYSYQITYIPLLVWVVGYCSFFCGCFLCGNSLKKNQVIDLNSFCLVGIDFKILKKGFYLLTILIALQIYLISLSYGYLPIQEILTGGSKNINDINTGADDTGFGQLGLFVNCLFLFNALLLTLIIKSVEEQHKLSFSIIICIAVAAFGTLVTGKRQGLFIMILFVASGLSIRFNDPIRSILSSFKIYLTKKKIFIMAIIFLAVLINLFGFMASVRVGSGYQISAFDEISNYLQWPLINFESQCEQAGFGPKSFNPAYTFAFLLPSRLSQELGVLTAFGPTRPEISSPSGFYELIHWGTGTYGVIIFAFIIGVISKYFYNNSFNSLIHLLIYCQMTWTLFASHTYNHFIFFAFLPLPCLLFYIFHLILSSKTRVNKAG